MRSVLLVTALLFAVVLGGLTIAVLVKDGPDPLTALSVLIVALFAFGIVGALRNPPGE